MLNNTRTAYGKLKNEYVDLEKKAASFETECNQLRQDLNATKNTLRTLEAIKAELGIDIAARRAQIADLEARLQHETSETKALRDENQRLDSRLVAADKRAVALEAELNSARQRLMLNEDEKRAVQSSLDQTIGENARLSRRLAETESSLAATLGRLRHVEANFAEVSTERTRLANTLEETNERHANETTTQRMRLEALQARAVTTEKLLGEARDHLTARAEDARNFDREISAIALERDTLAARLAEMEGERIQRDSELREIEQARSTLLERGNALSRAFTGKEAMLARAQENIQSLNDRIGFLETQLQASRQTAEQEIEELNAALRREKLERAVVEGALEAGRKDFARLMREVMALQRNQAAQEPTIEPLAANAA